MNDYGRSVVAAEESRSEARCGWYFFTEYGPLVISHLSLVDRLVIDERFVRASGPGGQNVNKVATAVELRVDLAASPLPEDVKARLIALAGTRVTSDGVLLIEAREHRTQGQNRDAARARLLAMVEQALRPPKKRTRTRPSKAAKERRLQSKKKRAVTKAGRSRVSDD